MSSYNPRLSASDNKSLITLRHINERASQKGRETEVDCARKEGLLSYEVYGIWENPAYDVIR